MEIRAREVLLKELEFADAKGNRKVVKTIRSQKLYKHYMYMELPYGGLDSYTDEELELLLRLTTRMDVQWQSWHHADSHLFYADRHVVFGKNYHTEGVVANWLCRRSSWTEGTTRPTLAEGLSRFYLTDLRTRGTWVCKADMVPYQITDEVTCESFRLLDTEGTFHWRDFLLAAPLKTELDELIDLYRRECKVKADWMASLKRKAT